jgi:hypothetical protein
MEFATIYFNECSQIKYATVRLVRNRLKSALRQSFRSNDISQRDPPFIYLLFAVSPQALGISY